MKDKRFMHYQTISCKNLNKKRLRKTFLFYFLKNFMSWKNIFEWLKLVLCHQKQFQANKNVLDSI